MADRTIIVMPAYNAEATLERTVGGLPPVKYVANRVLTMIENAILGQNLGEWHTG